MSKYKTQIIINPKKYPLGMKVYKLTRDFREWPYWKKGTMFGFEDDTGMVWGMKDKTTTNGYPLRTPLAGYLWALLIEKGLLKKVKYE